MKNMHSTNLKRTKTSKGGLQVKRQRSNSDRAEEPEQQYTPKTSSNDYLCQGRCNAVRRNIFTRSMSNENSAPASTSDMAADRSICADGLKDGGRSSMMEKNHLASGQSDISGAEDTPDYGRRIIRASYAQIKHGCLTNRRTQINSAGANIGVFQMKRVNNKQSSSSNPQNTNTHKGAIGQLVPDNANTDKCGIKTFQNGYHSTGMCKPEQLGVQTQQNGSQANRYSRSNKKSDLETDDLDVDIIYATGVEAKIQESTDVPANVPTMFTRVPLEISRAGPGCFMKLQSDGSETSQIYIYHHLATDDPKLGDRFGASVETTKKRKDGYYRHIIKNVDVKGVADQMKIRDDDELVLINNCFVPELDHQTVLALFRDAPVDQHTRFSLVLRRPLKDKTWEWVSTSAILIPELDNEPRVRELKFETDSGPTQIWQHWYRIQIPGSQMFLIITGGEVRVQVARGDLKNYNICVMSKCCIDPLTGDMSYVASMFGVHHDNKNQNSYVHVKETGEVCLNAQPQWFGFGKIGSKMEFKVQELNKYLGCRYSEHGTCGHLCVQDASFQFQSTGIEGSYDHPDTDSEVLSQPSSLASSSSFCSQPSSLSLRLSDASMSSFGSCSNGSSGDSGCYRHFRSSSKAFEDPISDSGSEFFSFSSDSCRTPNTPMDRLTLFSSEKKEI